MWVRLGRFSLVLVTVVLAGLGLTLSAQGINSLTLNQPPLVMVQFGDDVIHVQALGESLSINGQTIEETEHRLGQTLQRQAWRVLRQMGQAIAEFTQLVY